MESDGGEARLGAPQRVPAHALFFPLAAAYAAAALPASIAAMLGLVPPIPGLASPAGHAHEMLFGFALAAVAGNQLGPTLRWRLLLLLGAWLAGRAAFLAAPGSAVALAANAAFALILAAFLAPRLLIAAKKLRNRALPVTLVALCIAAIARDLVVGVLLLALLMLFMGGRIVAPAAAGQLYRQGGQLAARVQPRIEGALIVLMLFAAACAATGWTRAAGVAAIASGALAGVRLARWRLWALAARRDLLCLGAGYAWLALGLLGMGLAMARGTPATTVLHAITVGAIGTLTINVMALTWARLARRDPSREALPVAATVLVAAATAARLLAEGRASWLLFAALCWSGAYVLLLALFAKLRR